MRGGFFKGAFPRASRGDNDYCYATAIPRRLRDISDGPAASSSSSSLNRAFYDGSLRGPTDILALAPGNRGSGG